MFYDVMKAIDDCYHDSSMFFEAIKMNYREVYEGVLAKDDFDFNVCDKNGDNVMIRLLKNKDFDLVNKYIDDERININHQNNEGDTFLHILATMNYVDVKEIFEKILNRRDLLLNIKNNALQTVLDKAINNQYLYMPIKILEDKRFNNIGLSSFKHLYEKFIKSNDYGTYSKLNNFTLIYNNLKKKDLMPTMNKLIKIIKKEENNIKEDFTKSQTKRLDMIVNHLIEETI